MQTGGIHDLPMRPLPERNVGGALSSPLRVVLLLGALLVHVFVSLLWQSIDQQVPDGDEAGHLAAFYLFSTSVPERGVLGVLYDAFTGPGDYPPAFYLTYAFLHRLIPTSAPFPAGIGLLLTLTSSLTLLAAAGLARALYRTSANPPRYPVGLEAFTVACGATLPLLAAVSRQAMPEPFVALWVTVGLWAALESDGFRRWPACGVLGGALMMALLSKQTSLLYLGPPLLVLAGVALYSHGKQALLGGVLSVGIALPLPLWWLSLHWNDQVGYGLQSAGAKADVTWVQHLLYYPAALVGEGVGLFWTVPLLVAVGVLSWRRAWLPLLLVVSMAGVLVGVPKKYPRLLVPMLPAVASLVAVGLTLGMSFWKQRRAEGLVLAGCAALGLVQSVALGFDVPGLPDKLLVWSPELYRRLDPDCPQEWIRRASRDDLGFDAIVEVFRKSTPALGNQIAFLEEPSIPCRYETTFNYVFHLSDWTRRRGIELDEVATAQTEPERFEAMMPRVRVVVGVKPWCERGETDSSCRFRSQFEPAGTFEAKSERLRFTLYLYRRVRFGGDSG